MPPTPVLVKRTVWLIEPVETAASTVDYRNALPWGCLEMVSSRSLCCIIAQGCESTFWSLDPSLPEYVPSVPHHPLQSSLLWHPCGYHSSYFLIHKPSRSAHWLMQGRMGGMEKKCLCGQNTFRFLIFKSLQVDELMGGKVSPEGLKKGYRLEAFFFSHRKHKAELIVMCFILVSLLAVGTH